MMNEVMNHFFFQILEQVVVGIEQFAQFLREFRLRARVMKIREKYSLASAPVEYRPELWEDDKQLALFPL